MHERISKIVFGILLVFMIWLLMVAVSLFFMMGIVLF